MSTETLKTELRKCVERTCSRCTLGGSPACYVEVAIRELDRYEQAMDYIKSCCERED